jgi:SAM-dependent methyltransferase
MEVRAAIAVDWSGARTGGGRRIWLAEVTGDELGAFQNRWNVESLLAWLTTRAERDPSLVLGLDFAFSFPAWFVSERCGGTAQAAWELATATGEDWLHSPASPFWGRPGVPRPVLEGDRAHLRATEQALTGAYGYPKSVFQVGGAGAVGTGSIRGMPLLARLRRAGFAVWPFDPPTLPLVVEIYPRALTGPVVKNDPAARRRYLDAWGWPRDPALRTKVAETEDGFDAAVSARQMALHAEVFGDLPAPTDQERLEGRIWLPEGPVDRPAAAPGRAEQLPWRRSWDEGISLQDEWTAVAPDWITWARAPGHDSYWRFHRDRFIDLLPPPPLDVLDLGCGEGRLPRDLTALGYRTAGVDISPAMIAAARDADPSGRYEVANAAETPFADGSFDLVTAFMSLQDMEDMPAAVAETARVLRRGGCFGIAIVHPLNSAGGFESLAPEAAFRLEGPYLRERKYADEGGRDGLRIRFASYHRPLGAYFAALEEHGFLVDRLREVTVDARSVEARPDRERWLGIPLFLHLRALRP